MTFNEFLDELGCLSDQSWTVECGVVRNEFGQCPLTALASRKKGQFYRLSEPFFAGDAIGLDQKDIRKIISLAGSLAFPAEKQKMIKALKASIVPLV